VWRHIVVTYDNLATPRTRIYKDGVELAVNPQAVSGVINNFSTIEIGRRSDGVWAFPGLIDAVVIWDRPISAQEVGRLYATRYGDFGPFKMQVRSGSSTNALLSQPFVGSDGSSGSFYLNEALVEAGTFRPTDRYFQYQTLISASADQSLSPYVESIGIYGTRTSIMDTLYGDFRQGTFTSNTTNAPAWSKRPYIGLARSANGGYPQSGYYISPTFDSGKTDATWIRMAWSGGDEISTTQGGLIGLYHLDGNWADVSGVGNNTPALSNAVFATAGKLGAGAALFRDFPSTSTAYAFGFGTIGSLEFWIRPNVGSCGILTFTNGMDIALLNNTIVMRGFGANSPTLHVNGNPNQRVLDAGWSHVVLNWNAGVSASGLQIGHASGAPLIGLLDEVAVYNRPLLQSEIMDHYLAARPEAAGLVAFQVRSANTVPDLAAATWSAAFTSPQFTPLPVNGRYFQFRASFEGDGSYTPAFGDMVITEDVLHRIASWEDASAGAFVDGLTTWYGDAILLPPIGQPAPAPVFWQTEIGLGGLWMMDESIWGGANVVVDSSGLGRNGSAQNGATPSLASKVGTACGSFDGTDDYVALVTLPELTGESFTVAGWFNTRSQTLAPVFSSYAAGGDFISVELNTDVSPDSSGRLSFVVSDGVSGVRSVNSFLNDLNDGNWHHYAAVRDGSDIHLYVDGERVGTVSIGGGYGSIVGAAPNLGRRGSQDIYYSGRIDDTAIWGRALQSREIGRLFAGGYQTRDTGVLTSAVIDASRPVVWQQLFWSINGVFGRALNASDALLRGLWSLDMTSGAAPDSTSYANHGTVTGADYGVPGVFGNAIELNGSGAHVAVPHSVSLEPAVISIEAWVFARSINSRVIVSKRNSSAGYALSTDADGHVVFWLGGTECRDWLPLLRNAWQHVCGTFDGTTMRLYVNGMIRAHVTPVGVQIASGSPLYFGRSHAGGNFFRGSLDQVAIWSKALSSIEIEDHYRAYIGEAKFQARAGNTPVLGDPFVGPDGTPSSYYLLSSGDSLLSMPLGRYLQFRAEIRSGDHKFTPILSGVRVAVASYSSDAPWISPTVAAGFGFLGDLLGFDHTRTFNPGSDVRYQISGDGHAAAASNRWFYYDSTSGQWTPQALTNAASIYQIETSTKDQVNAQIGKFYSQVYNATGGVFRFKAFLKSGGDQQVAVSNVTVTASRGRIVVKTPNGDERGERALISGVPTRVEWSWAGVVSDNLEVAYSLNGYGGPWTVIATGVARGADGTNSVSWTTPQVPLNAEGLAFTSNAVVRIRDLNDATVRDTSDRAFEITQRFNVVAPNGGERWYIGEINDIRWESSFDLSTRASIYFAPDGNNFFAEDGGYMIEFLATNTNASAGNVFPWQTPLNVASLLSTNARIRVQAPNGAYADASDNPFSLVGIVVTSPTAGQKVKRGADDGFNIQWRSISAGTNVHVDVSLDGGATFLTNIYSFAANQDGDNVLNWNVTQPESDQAVLRVRSLSDGRIIGYSEAFTIAGIDVIAPDGGEEWLAGTTNTIRWLAGGAGNTVSIFYTDLYEGTNTVWLPIAERIPNSLSYPWVVSERVSPVARVKVQSDEDPTLNAISAQNFSIAGVRVTYPNLPGDTLVMGQQATMTHAGAPMRWLRVKLEISYDRAATWQTLGLGAEEWTLRQPFLFRPTFPSRQTKVRATVLGATAQDLVTPLTNIIDLSDDYFTVEGMLMEAPAAGSTNTLGTQTEIRWVSAGGDPTVSIFYSSQGTNTFQLIDQGVFNNQTYPGRNPYAWTVPTTLLPSESARIKVVSGKYQAMTPPFILRGIRITTPVSGDVLNIGSSHVVRWLDAGMNKVGLLGSISLSLDGGATFEVLAPSHLLTELPSYDWTINPGLSPTTNAMIRLQVTSSTTPADVGFVANSDRFTLKGIKILSPAAGGTVKLGATNTIAFIAAAAGSTATITYSADGGATYDPVPVVANLPITTGLNTFDWAVELNRTPSTNAVIRITGPDASKVSGVFTMGGIRVDRPMQYDIWAVGEFNTIQWVAQVPEAIFNLDLIYPDSTTLSLAQNVAGSSRNYQLPVAALRGLDTISNVVLRVSDRAGTAAGLSEPFRLVSQPVIEVVAPAAGDYIPVGEEVQITWVKGGSMQAEHFTVWFSGDNFATPPEDVGRTVTFNPANNTYSMPWVVPDRLGPTTIMVTNSVNPNLTAYSGVFNIVGSFELTYPNGEEGEEDIYANQTKAVSWFTEGSVPFVNLYYKAGAGDWVKINSTPFDNNPRQGRYQTFYQWTTPTLRTDSVRLRVQDAGYPDPNLFDGTRIGPYDDSDGIFALKFFTVAWEVGFMHEDEVTGVKEFRGLDKLSVTDSSGWSVTGLTSPFTTNYPYGTFDTVWYRQFFNDKVDFRWLSDRDQTRRLIMLPSDTEPDATVLANFTYDPGKMTLTAHAWIERGGRILNNPDSATIHIFDTDGTKLKVLTSSSVLADGFFRIKWENVLDTLTEGETYLARVEVMYNRVIYSAAVTYTLSLAPEFATVEAILDRVTNLQSNLTGQITGLTDLTTDFRDRAMSSLGTLEEQSGTILTNVARVAGQIDGFTNTVVAPLSLLTNLFVEVLGPTLTNMAAQVQEVVDATAGDQARILNRPSTVEFGSTNTVLYKTSRGLDAGTVRLTVEGTGRQFTMTEVGSGLGIYGVDIIADWGLGSTMISCSDPNASDRMILEVVQAGAGSIGELAATLESMESQMTNMTAVVRALNDPVGGLSALISDIGNSISQVESALSEARGGSSSGAAGAAASLEALLGGGGVDGDGASTSLFNSLIGMSSRLDQIYGESSDASRFASSARNEAGSAVTAVRELKEMLETGEFSMEAAAGRMEAIRAAMETASANIENIPRAVGAQAMQTQIDEVARQIERMAAEQGFVYEVMLKQAKTAEEGGVGGEGANEEIITVLNQNMSEVKVSLAFMQKVLDEQQNQPVVMDSWIGVE
jgi:hypothetical protein